VLQDPSAETFDPSTLDPNVIAAITRSATTSENMA